MPRNNLLKYLRVWVKDLCCNVVALQTMPGNRVAIQYSIIQAKDLSSSTVWRHQYHPCSTTTDEHFVIFYEQRSRQMGRDSLTHLLRELHSVSPPTWETTWKAPNLKNYFKNGENTEDPWYNNTCHTTSPVHHLICMIIKKRSLENFWWSLLRDWMQKCWVKYRSLEKH